MLQTNSPQVFTNLSELFEQKIMKNKSILDTDQWDQIYFTDVAIVFWSLFKIKGIKLRGNGAFKVGKDRHNLV